MEILKTTEGIGDLIAVTGWSPLDTLLRLDPRRGRLQHTRTPDRGNEGADNLRLGTCALAAELCGEHAKRLPIVLRMLEDGLDATEVGPTLAFPDHTDQVIDPRGSIGDHGQ